MYQVGDRVVHPMHGAGIIESIVQERLGGQLGIQPEQVNVKATTEEHLGFTGEGLGMSAHAVALIQRVES